MKVAVNIRWGHLNHEPRCVVTRRIVHFCAHCQAANDTPSNGPEAFASPRTVSTPFAVRSCPGPDALLRRAGVTVETMADAGTGENSISHDASLGRGGQHDHA